MGCMEYAKSFYNTNELKTYAEKYLKKLPKDVTCLLSIGSSGCSIASAMLALSTKNLRHISVRKEKEARKSHDWEYAGVRDSKDIYCIVDDFISTGATIENLLKKIKYFENINYILVCYLELLTKKELLKRIKTKIKIITINK
jgi:orotate phosphoribosyltransferase-like protein